MHAVEINILHILKLPSLPRPPPNDSAFGNETTGPDSGRGPVYCCQCTSTGVARCAMLPWVFR